MPSRAESAPARLLVEIVTGRVGRPAVRAVEADWAGVAGLEEGDAFPLRHLKPRLVEHDGTRPQVL
jgi:hypothetical protein